MYKERIQRLYQEKQAISSGISGGEELARVIQAEDYGVASVSKSVAHNLTDLQQRLQRKTFDFDNPIKNISRSLLRSFEQLELNTMLYRSRGKITSSMIVKLGFCFGLKIPASFIDCDSTDESHAADDQEHSPSDDSQEEPDEAPQRVIQKDCQNLPCSEEEMKEIIWLLKRELRNMYSDCVKAEKEFAEKERLANRIEELPNYKLQQKPIASSAGDFIRMRNRNILTSSGSTANNSQTIELSMPSTFQTSTVIEEVASTTVDSVESRESKPFGSRSFGLDSSRNSLFHPQKDPAVFSHFYPSKPSPEARQLPIFSHVNEILAFVRTRHVIIVSGMTGTGKSTQVPLMVLDECAKNQVPCNIIVTQPRKLAAMGVAQRVCKERDWKLGQLVGYHVGLDRNTSSATRLTYCTTGVFVEKIVATKHLNEYTHIFLDEIHERGQDTDLSLMLVRQMFKENSPDVQIILMSATAEVNKLSDYFKEACRGMDKESLPGQVHVAHSTHVVHETFLEEITDQPTVFEFNIRKSNLPHELLVLAVDCMSRLIPVETDGIRRNATQFEPILVFLPGLEHIMEMADLLKQSTEKTRIQVDVMILHSTVSREDQLRVLEPPPGNVRRVILSTNIAESSITIPYINYARSSVFDFCLTKSMCVNSVTKNCQLRMQWSSRSNCMQRRGRVGRLRAGRVYFFVPHSFYTDALPANPEPEILVAPLENSVLRVKLLGVEIPPAEILVLLPDPPNQNEVDLAVLNLKEAGALTVNFNGTPSYADGDLTALGQLMAWLPLDIRVARFLLLCAMFGYAQEGVVIAAGMTVDSPFLTSSNRSPDYVVKMNLLYHRGVRCDALAILYAFQEWCRVAGCFGSRQEEKAWCEGHLIDRARIKEMTALKKEIWHRLSRRGLPETNGNLNRPKVEVVLPILFAGAFYPNVLVNSGSIEDPMMGKILLGYDPLRTCVIPLFGHSTSQQAVLYDDQLRKTLRLDENVKIIYGSQQTFICYPRLPDADAVTETHVGLMQLRTLCEKRRLVRLVQERPLVNMAELIGHAVNDASIHDSRVTIGKSTCPIYPNLNLMNHKTVPVIVADIASIKLFWLGNWDADAQKQQIELMQLLVSFSKQPDFAPITSNQLKIGNAYISCKPNSVQITRAILLSLPDVNDTVSVLLPDVGLYDRIPTEWLHCLPEICSRSIPRACFEFMLVGLRFIKKQEEEALGYVRRFLTKDDVQVELQIFSILDGVVRGDLYFRSKATGGKRIHLNKELIQLGFAYPGAESWISKYDSKRRSNICFEILPTVENATALDPQPTEVLTDRIYIGPLSFPSLSRMKTIGRLQMAVNIDLGSLNSFPFDPYPQDRAWPYRAITAAKLTHPTTSDDRLKAVVTSALPVQPGLLGIVALLFAPRLEFRCNKNQLIGVLTGLGPLLGKRHSFYPDGEVELVFDGDIGCDDVSIINELRLTMNDFLRCIRGDRDIEKSVDDIQKTCQELLLKLLNKSRSCCPFQSTWQQFKWTTDNLDQSADENFRAAELTFLTPLVVKELTEPNDLMTHNVILHRKAAARMEELSRGVPASESMVVSGFCSACQMKFPGGDGILEHLDSELHQSMENNFLELKMFKEATAV